MRAKKIYDQTNKIIDECIEKSYSSLNIDFDKKRDELGKRGLYSSSQYFKSCQTLVNDNIEKLIKSTYSEIIKFQYINNIIYTKKQIKKIYISIDKNIKNHINTEINATYNQQVEHLEESTDNDNFLSYLINKLERDIKNKKENTEKVSFKLSTKPEILIAKRAIRISVIAIIISIISVVWVNWGQQIIELF